MIYLYDVQDRRHILLKPNRKLFLTHNTNRIKEGKGHRVCLIRMLGFEIGNFSCFEIKTQSFIL